MTYKAGASVVPAPAREFNRPRNCFNAYPAVSKLRKSGKHDSLQTGDLHIRGMSNLPGAWADWSVVWNLELQDLPEALSGHSPWHLRLLSLGYHQWPSIADFRTWPIGIGTAAAANTASTALTQQ